VDIQREWPSQDNLERRNVISRPNTKIRWVRGRYALAVAALLTGVGLPLAATASAQAATASPTSMSSWYCNAWVTSNGQPGGGVSGFCDNGAPNYRVAGLCINIFTNSSWWIYGKWTSSGVSYATCPWYAHPGQYPFMQTR
jgi:hypothetical protein